MSRGWESKSVESQMEEAASRRAAVRKTPPTAEQMRLQSERDSLQLSRTRVLKDLEGATHPRRREQLEAALGHLDRKLADLERVSAALENRGNPLPHTNAHGA
jgi:hypothetical protein